MKRTLTFADVLQAAYAWKTERNLVECRIFMNASTADRFCGLTMGPPPLLAFAQGEVFGWATLGCREWIVDNDVPDETCRFEN